MVQYCKKCVMPSTRPGITFNKEGICAGCLSYENRKNVDYSKRWEEFKVLCDKYRGMNGPNGYDCMIAVSGGKDSHFQVYILKEVMGMNPLLVSAEDNFPMTEAGKHNIKNISEAFGCDLISKRRKQLCVIHLRNMANRLILSIVIFIRTRYIWH